MVSRNRPQEKIKINIAKKLLPIFFCLFLSAPFLLNNLIYLNLWAFTHYFSLFKNSKVLLNLALNLCKQYQRKHWNKLPLTTVSSSNMAAWTTQNKRHKKTLGNLFCVRIIFIFSFSTFYFKTQLVCSIPKWTNHLWQPMVILL